MKPSHLRLTSSGVQWAPPTDRKCPFPIGFILDSSTRHFQRGSLAPLSCHRKIHHMYCAWSIPVGSWLGFFPFQLQYCLWSSRHEYVGRLQLCGVGCSAFCETYPALSNIPYTGTTNWLLLNGRLRHALSTCSGPPATQGPTILWSCGYAVGMPPPHRLALTRIDLTFGALWDVGTLGFPQSALICSEVLTATSFDTSLVFPIGTTTWALPIRFHLCFCFVIIIWRLVTRAPCGSPFFLALCCLCYWVRWLKGCLCLFTFGTFSCILPWAAQLGFNVLVLSVLFFVLKKLEIGAPPQGPLLLPLILFKPQWRLAQYKLLCMVKDWSPPEGVFVWL